jgi:8-oxo-dGTP pyrophosphatase MutT (NUDIX family)
MADSDHAGVPPPPPVSPWGKLDPRDVPVIHRYADLPPVPPERLHPAFIRRRVATPPIWLPEHEGDRTRIGLGAIRPAAVLVPIVQRSAGPTVLLTQRPTHMREHAGQVAFPGGRSDAADTSPIDTALREAWEEIGLLRDRIDVIGQMPSYLTGTGYEVTPVVALIDPDFELTLHSGEVAEAFEVPLHFLMDPRHHERRHLVQPGIERQFLAMPYISGGREFFIWGATAAMLRNLYRLLMA